MSTDPFAERIAVAGVGLGALGHPVGRRPGTHRPCQITECDVRLLAFLHDFIASNWDGPLSAAL